MRFRPLAPAQRVCVALAVVLLLSVLVVGALVQWNARWAAGAPRLTVVIGAYILLVLVTGQGDAERGRAASTDL